MAVWANHDDRWSQLIDDYRRFFRTSAHRDVLVPGWLRVCSPEWPYLKASNSDPTESGQWAAVWPFQECVYAGGEVVGPTQQGVLGQSPMCFALLKEMITEWRHALNRSRG